MPQRVLSSRDAAPVTDRARDETAQGLQVAIGDVEPHALFA